MVDPRELTPGFAFAQRNLGTAWGVLRDGRTRGLACEQGLTRHKAHAMPTWRGQCAQAELERRLPGPRRCCGSGTARRAGRSGTSGRAAAGAGRPPGPHG